MKIINSAICKSFPFSLLSFPPSFIFTSLMVFNKMLLTVSLLITLKRFSVFGYSKQFCGEYRLTHTDTSVSCAHVWYSLKHVPKMVSRWKRRHIFNIINSVLFLKKIVRIHSPALIV